ncbi:cobalt-precorrin 5A hydrolase / precorrin-3B C17-methyltransferase [Lentzea xinjiangensis]|uniref:Cobalt-precorrin 5A hydrolase / precorrin-3B C17-methyltransferase n=1 Tax=Lentzea xinjiangensis TaxID=402600 RepID=A0A1H9WBL4_9PSEU|nr:cobalamin biosynthesis protein [Lentzea xinjiangensis]SES31300.1 cobalt-precorrin 5A hydrolase / precorrin-3B C17-methyltransferase [Lentzea xinjiangensis]
MIGVFAGPGRRGDAADLAGLLGADAVVPDGLVKPALHQLWPRLGAVVLFLDAGSAVRLIAPLLRDRRTDPAVVCVDEHFAVALAGAADALARQVADLLNRTAVVTSGPSIDSVLDELVEQLDATADGDVEACVAAIDAGEKVVLRNPLSFPLPALPPNVVAEGEDATWVIVVDDRAAATKGNVLRIVPRTLVVGVGSTRGASATSVGAALSELDSQGGLDLRAIKAFATADAKADEPGIVDAVEDWGFWHGDTAELLTYPTEELAEIGVPNPSSVVRNSMGTASVAEAAALRGARSIGHGGQVELAAEKFKRDNVTVAAARVLPRGRLALVGLGPGGAEERTPRAEAEIRRAAFVVGAPEAIDAVGPLLRSGTEIRHEGACELAARGAAVAFVAFGAGPTLDGPVDADVVVVPGVENR